MPGHGSSAVFFVAMYIFLLILYQFLFYANDIVKIVLLDSFMIVPVI